MESSSFFRNSCLFFDKSGLPDLANFGIFFSPPDFETIAWAFLITSYRQNQKRLYVRSAGLSFLGNTATGRLTFSTFSKESPPGSQVYVSARQITPQRPSSSKTDKSSLLLLSLFSSISPQPRHDQLSPRVYFARSLSHPQSPLTSLTPRSITCRRVYDLFLSFGILPLLLLVQGMVKPSLLHSLFFPRESKNFSLPRGYVLRPASESLFPPRN